MIQKNIVIVVGSFHKTAGERMVQIAQKTAQDFGLNIVEVIWVPGSMEKPLALKRALLKDTVQGAVALGIIERGQTKHGLVMGQAVVSAIVQLQLELLKPIGLGILGPEILPEQIEPRLEKYATAAVQAVAEMMK